MHITKKKKKPKNPKTKAKKHWYMHFKMFALKLTCLVLPLSMIFLETSLYLLHTRINQWTRSVSKFYGLPSFSLWQLEMTFPRLEIAKPNSWGVLLSGSEEQISFVHSINISVSNIQQGTPLNKNEWNTIPLSNSESIHRERKFLSLFLNTNPREAACEERHELEPPTQESLLKK